MPEGSLQVNHLETNGIEVLPYLQLSKPCSQCSEQDRETVILANSSTTAVKINSFYDKQEVFRGPTFRQRPFGPLDCVLRAPPPKKFSPILPKCQPTLQKCLPSQKSLFLPLKILPTPQKWVSIYHTGSHIRWKPFEGRIVDMCVMDTCDTYVCTYVVSHSVTTH